MKPPLQKIEKNMNDNHEGNDNDLFDPLATPAIARYRQSRNQRGDSVESDRDEDKMKANGSNDEEVNNGDKSNNDDETGCLFNDMSDSEKESLRQHLFDQCHQAADNSRNGFPEDAEEGRKVFESVYIQQKALLGKVYVFM